jgi:tetratricopeptide (TPR) repeat protein
MNIILSKYGRSFIVAALFLAAFIILPASYSRAEFDSTRKMKARAQDYFDKGQYYKAIDTWAEVLKLDSYDSQALQGISKSQDIINKPRFEKENAARARLKELIQEGKNYKRDREYKKAIASWGEALSIDPANKEILDLIESARVRAEYQIEILDKLDKEKRLKTPYVKDIAAIANKMVNLLEKTDAKIKETRRGEIEKDIKDELDEVPELEETPQLTEPLRLPDEQPEERKPEIIQLVEKNLMVNEGPIVKESGSSSKPAGFILAAALISVSLIFALLFFTTRLRNTVPAKRPSEKPKRSEGFEPRDLKKFLDPKDSNKDKDIFH